MVEINNLNFSYNDKKVLRDLFLNIGDNEKVSIIGPSGCGKSTLLNIILGTLTDYTGKCLVFNEEVNGVNKEISMVFQKNGLFEFLTIKDNLLLATIDEDKIDEYAMKLNILDHLNKYPKDLSGGQLQRANICRSLLMNKHLMLMDEPTSSLDEFAKEAFQKQVMELIAKKDFGYILVTHDIKEALVMSNRIILLKDGNINKEFISPFYSKTDSYLKNEFNDMYLEIKKEFYD